MKFSFEMRLVNGSYSLVGDRMDLFRPVAAEPLEDGATAVSARTVDGTQNRLKRDGQKSGYLFGSRQVKETKSWWISEYRRQVSLSDEMRSIFGEDGSEKENRTPETGEFGICNGNEKCLLSIESRFAKIPHSVFSIRDPVHCSVYRLYKLNHRKSNGNRSIPTIPDLIGHAFLESPKNWPSSSCPTVHF